MECLQWHPAALRMEFEETYGLRLPSLTFDRLMAGVAVLTTDFFFQDVSRFIQLANVLSGSEFNPEEFDPADSVECAWAITEALLLRPPDEEDQEPFSDDVRRYVGLVLRNEGFVNPPDVLRIAIDGDLSDQVRTDYSDNPELFSVIYQVQLGKKEEVETVLREGLAELFEQLKSLPLKNGSTENLEKRVGQAIRTP